MPRKKQRRSNDPFDRIPWITGAKKAFVRGHARMALGSNEHGRYLQIISKQTGLTVEKLFYERATTTFAAYIAQAERGNHAAAHWLIGIGATFLQAGEPCPEPIRSWLADRLMDVAQGEQAQQALRTRKPPQRIRSNEARNAAIAFAVGNLLDQGLPLRLNQTGQGACAQVGDQYGLSEDRVLEIWYDSLEYLARS